MTVSTSFSSIQSILSRRGLNKGGTVQKYVDSEVLRLCAPYTPFDTGVLKGSGIRATKIGSGIVKWNTPYARYQYYGKVMVGKAPKTVTSRSLTYGNGSLRGSYWFERMKINNKDKIIKGAAALAGGQGKCQ